MLTPTYLMVPQSIQASYHARAEDRVQGTQHKLTIVTAPVVTVKAGVSPWQPETFGGKKKCGFVA